MKTLNGAPQAETSDYSQLYIEGIAQDVVDATNDKLREWAESQRCVRCKFLKDNMCANIGFWFSESDTPMKPETFSCAAFEEKS